MLAHRESVIGRKNHISVPGLSGLFQCVKNFSDLRIHISNMGVIFGAPQPDGTGCSRQGGQQFITNVTVALIERVFGQVVGRQKDPVFRIPVGELLWRLPRVVRRVETHIEEEGSDLTFL